MVYYTTALAFELVSQATHIKVFVMKPWWTVAIRTTDGHASKLEIVCPMSTQLRAVHTRNCGDCGLVLELRFAVTVFRWTGPDGTHEKHTRGSAP